MIGFFFKGRLCEYQVEARLGEGGFGQVFRVRDPQGRPFAMKLLHEPLDQDAQRRFQGEQAILQPIRHPNIIEVVDHGIDEDGHPFYTMPLMAGGTVADVIARDASWEEILKLVGDAAKGLAAFHAVRGIHRDIKPENILIDGNGNGKIADFGLARCEVLSGRSITRTAMGTPGYMAPEVWANDACEASDVYSLGIVLAELAAGTRHLIPARPPKLKALGGDLKYINELYEAMVKEDPGQRPMAVDVGTHCDRLIAWMARGKEQAKESASSWQQGLAIVGGVTLAVGAIAGVAALVDAAMSDRRR